MLSARAEVEGLIEATGGIPVTVAGVETWGHRLFGYFRGGRDPEILVKSVAAKVPADVVPEAPEGTAVQMSGIGWKVSSVDIDEDDGAMTILVLRRA